MQRKLVVVQKQSGISVSVVSKLGGSQIQINRILTQKHEESLRVTHVHLSGAWLWGVVAVTLCQDIPVHLKVKHWEKYLFQLHN